MTAFDTSMSNGTCYWKAGSEAGPDFIPCGNAFASDINFQCCSLGDKCFDNGACFNAKYGATYLAACTDPDYQAAECPQKGKYSGQQWNGLVICGKPTDSFTKDVPWAGCPEPNLDHLTTFSTGCECNDTNPPLFTDYATLVSTAILPKTKGGTLLYINGRSAPTVSTIRVQTIASASSATASDSVVTSAMPTITTGVITSATGYGSGLSSGDKAGIAAGISAAALLLGVILFIVWLLMRKKLKDKQRTTTEAGPKLKPSSQLDSASSGESSSASAPNTHGDASGFLGYKAELAADSPPSSGTIVYPVSPASPQFQVQQRHYEAYNPAIHGNYSQHSNRSELHSQHRDTIYGSVPSVSPQHTGSSQGHALGGNDGHTQTATAPIPELQG